MIIYPQHGYPTLQTPPHMLRLSGVCVIGVSSCMTLKIRLGGYVLAPTGGKTPYIRLFHYLPFPSTPRRGKGLDPPIFPLGCRVSKFF